MVTGDLGHVVGFRCHPFSRDFYVIVTAVRLLVTVCTTSGPWTAVRVSLAASGRREKSHGPGTEA